MREQLKLDTEADKTYREKECIRSKQRMQNAVQYRKILDKNNRNVAKYKQDPVKKAKVPTSYIIPKAITWDTIQPSYKMRDKSIRKH